MALIPSPKKIEKSSQLKFKLALAQRRSNRFPINKLIFSHHRALEPGLGRVESGPWWIPPSGHRGKSRKVSTTSNPWLEKKNSSSWGPSKFSEPCPIVFVGKKKSTEKVTDKVWRPPQKTNTSIWNVRLRCEDHIQQIAGMFFSSSFFRGNGPRRGWKINVPWGMTTKPWELGPEEPA